MLCKKSHIPPFFQCLSFCLFFPSGRGYKNAVHEVYEEAANFFAKSLVSLRNKGKRKKRKNCTISLFNTVSDFVSLYFAGFRGVRDDP